jgi:hypothetical protein
MFSRAALHHLESQVVIDTYAMTWAWPGKSLPANRLRLAHPRSWSFQEV